MCISLNKKFLTVLIIGAASYYFIGKEKKVLASVPIKEISIEEVSSLVDEKSAYIFDANSEKTFQEGHLHGARHLPFTEVTKTNLPNDISSKIVFYCWNRLCSASHEAAKRAVELGYQNVFVMRDGITGWKKADKQIVTSQD